MFRVSEPLKNSLNDFYFFFAIIWFISHFSLKMAFLTVGNLHSIFSIHLPVVSILKLITCCKILPRKNTIFWNGFLVASIRNLNVLYENTLKRCSTLVHNITKPSVLCQSFMKNIKFTYLPIYVILNSK